AAMAAIWASVWVRISAGDGVSPVPRSRREGDFILSLEQSLKAQIYLANIEDAPDCLDAWNQYYADIPCAVDRLPIHRSESPTGYSSAGCSPAEPASASPVTDNSSSIPIRRSNQMRCST